MSQRELKPPPGPEPETGSENHTVSKVHGGLLKLSIGALGVVYGDIGTSPLYSMKECFAPGHGVAPTQTNVLGVLSLIVWTLALVVVVKYITFILRADNQGEGGVLSLLALVTSKKHSGTKANSLLIPLGLFGAALLYGDGVITPSISVLSAVEGLEVATTAVTPFVVPITVAILVGLFLVQRRGTAGIGAVFGPAMITWLLAMTAAGLPWIVREPSVLLAVNPLHAVRFFIHHGLHGFLLLGSVVLCVTGGEALYADMGHFGREPIRRAWYFAVFPALLCNYFGQGAVLLARGEAVRENPFFAMLPPLAIYPMVAIAAVATVVASQALISGAFSLTRQAVQLGYCPRLTIVHTASGAEGQIYIPEVNRLLMVACVALVLAFRESSRLAGAYGIAVTGTMAITSLLFYKVTRDWAWPLWKSLTLVSLFLVIDLAFFGANLVKITDGGWFPLVVAAGVFAVMTTWKAGRRALGVHVVSNTLSIELFLNDVRSTKPHRVSGTAVFMSSNPEGAPPVLLHHFKHNRVLHETVLLLSIQTEHVPEVPESESITVTSLGDGFFKIIARYGYMQTPDVTAVLERCKGHGLNVDVRGASFYLGRETLLTTGRSGLARWRKALFAYLSRNALPANAFYNIPPNRVVELGTQIQL